MTTSSTSASGGARLLHADLDGVLSASRNFSALASRLPSLHTRAIGTLRRRLPVEARRDIQAEYPIGARRLPATNDRDFPAPSPRPPHRHAPANR